MKNQSSNTSRPTLEYSVFYRKCTVEYW